MKKYFVVMIIFLCLLFNSFADENKSDSVFYVRDADVGFRFGLGLLSATPGSNVCKNKIGISANATVFSNIQFSENYFFKPEFTINYDFLFHTSTDKNYGVDVCDIGFLSMEIPIIIKRKITINNFCFGAFLGEQISFSLGNQFYYDPLGKFTGNFLVPSVNIGSVIGLDYIVNTKNGRLYFDMRYIQYFLDSKYNYNDYEVILGKLFRINFSISYAFILN